ncbi:hypothetical protein ACFRJ8_14900 [Arthrobacter sp. NPDC056886]|uniref:hypothetical protein n=1 Tax=Arthrobacter sp. NPDC056886 TaxID=3345960 RepID=UPI00366E147E
MSNTSARFATYPGDTTHIIGEIKGPNTWGERLTAVTADYDPAADQTRVGFAYTTTNDIEASK